MRWIRAGFSRSRVLPGMVLLGAALLGGCPREPNENLETSKPCATDADCTAPALCMDSTCAIPSGGGSSSSRAGSSGATGGSSAGSGATSQAAGGSSSIPGGPSGSSSGPAGSAGGSSDMGTGSSSGTVVVGSSSSAPAGSSSAAGASSASSSTGGPGPCVDGVTGARFGVCEGTLWAVPGAQPAGSRFSVDGVVVEPLPSVTGARFGLDGEVVVHAP